MQIFSAVVDLADGGSATERHPKRPDAFGEEEPARVAFASLVQPRDVAHARVPGARDIVVPEELSSVERTLQRTSWIRSGLVLWLRGGWARTGPGTTGAGGYLFNVDEIVATARW
jgi:hypothetical protein